MPFVNPYHDLVDGRDLVSLFAQTARELPDLVAVWSAERFASSYAPGKWSGHRIVLHMLHVELVDGLRLRMALSTPGYVVQSFDPEAWMEADPIADGPRAVAAWSALRSLHLDLLHSLAPGDWGRSFIHPAAGPMTVRDLAGIWVGHDLHHLIQLREIDRIEWP
jgi:hypothetical protein